ncbi:hypothetical protein TNCV_1213431 [Trichonephila clavipes]|nr:hypothetical protein TNCV_1213431 [Trichonephila clavipes]
MNSVNKDKEGACSNSGEKREDVKPKDSQPELKGTAWTSRSHYALHRSVVKKTTHTRRANSLIGCCPDLGSLFTTGPCVYPNHRKASGRETSDITAPITCAANNTYSPTPPFGVVSRTTGLECYGMEPGRLLRRII